MFLGDDTLMAVKNSKNLRPNVCMLVCNDEGKLFLGERYGKPGHWQFPQGGVEPRQSLRTTVVRELREEIGVERKHIRSITKLKARHSYRWKNPPAYAKGKWIGQSQTFWLIHFKGKNSDINLAASDDQEFQDWCWCSASTVRKKAAPERVKGYEEALREFAELRRTKSRKTKTKSK